MIEQRNEGWTKRGYDGTREQQNNKYFLGPIQKPGFNPHSTLCKESCWYNPVKALHSTSRNLLTNFPEIYMCSMCCMAHHMMSSNQGSHRTLVSALFRSICMGHVWRGRQTGRTCGAIHHPAHSRRGVDGEGMFAEDQRKFSNIFLRIRLWVRFYGKILLWLVCNGDCPQFCASHNWNL